MSDIGWKTMSGEVIEFSEMTDSHIEFAIKFHENRKITSNQDYDRKIKCLHYLKKEKERRHIQNKKNEAKTECPWCAPGDMELVEVEHKDPFPDVGFGSVEYSHYLLCPNCGARGPKKKGRMSTTPT